jgi:hypothetical protein
MAERLETSAPGARAAVNRLPWSGRSPAFPVGLIGGQSFGAGDWVHECYELAPGALTDAKVVEELRRQMHDCD